MTPHRHFILFFALIFCWIQSNAVHALALSERHTPSGLNSHFDFKGDNFSDYRKHIRNIILKSRIDIATDQARNNEKNDIINANLPFELLPSPSCPRATKGMPYSKGILLIHGLSDSPYTLHHLGTFLQQQCFYVMTILLPGNGTRPGDLLDVRWQEWVKATEFGTKLVKRKANTVWIGGFSLGATLALQQATQQPDIAGLIMISPALQLPAMAAYASWRQWFGYFSETALWWQVQPDEDHYKYESFPVNAISQLYKLIQSIETTLKQPPSIPVLIAASEDDASVDSRATIDIFKRWPHSHKQLIWYSREMQAQQGIVQIVDSRSTDRHIASGSHVSLLIPDSDAYYGSNGQYAACTHYYEEQPDQWRQCKAKQEDILAETTPYFLSQGTVRRITYNLYFDDMLQTIATFVGD